MRTGSLSSCEVDESVADLSRGTALALYRIAQEALGNAAKHAAPTRVEVRLARAGARRRPDDRRRRAGRRSRAGRKGRARARQHARARAAVERHVRAGQPTRAGDDGSGRRPVSTSGTGSGPRRPADAIASTVLRSLDPQRAERFAAERSGIRSLGDELATRGSADQSRDSMLTSKARCGAPAPNCS